MRLGARVAVGRPEGAAARCTSSSSFVIEALILAV
jgi:hypothetical protein